MKDHPESSCTPDAYSQSERLAVYGSLAPGKANAHLLAGVEGCWVPATVSGILEDGGWAAAGGYPGLRLDPDAPAVSVLIFCSNALPSMWDDLDRFEGADYRRTVTMAIVAGRDLPVNIYELR